MTEIFNVWFDEDDIFSLDFTEFQKILITAGKDGIPCTHSWDGTTLTVTSASGTSSADLRGERGHSITDVSLQFYASTSNTAQVGGSWTDTVPAVAIGNYLWTRCAITYSDGRVTYTAPVCDTSWEAATAVGNELKAHVAATNPHGITISQIGAAPAGYGLGGNAKVLSTFKELDGIAECGWYYVKASYLSDAITIDDFMFTAANVFVSGNAFSDIVQEMNIPGTNYKLVRTISNGTPGAWEWVTPPMLAGPEYRTTERYNGLPVYAKLIYCGELPNATYKDASVGVAMTNVVSLNVIATDAANNWRFQLPYIAPNGAARCVANIVGYNVRIYAVNYDMSAYTGMALVKYTKD